MGKTRRTVELDTSDVTALEEIASHDRRTVEEVLVVAVKNYIARRSSEESEWVERWDRAVSNIRGGVPDDMTPAELEAEVRAAQAEYREQRRALHG